jgi:hypothetical protein
MNPQVSHTSIIFNILRMTEEYDIQDFIYGIIPKNDRPVSGSL